MRINTKRLSRLALKKTKVEKIAKKIRDGIAVDIARFRIEVKAYEYLVTVAGKRVTGKTVEGLRMALLNESMVKSVSLFRNTDTWRPHQYEISVGKILGDNPILVDCPKVDQVDRAKNGLANAKHWLSVKEAALKGDEPERTAEAVVRLMDACESFTNLEDTESGSICYRIMDSDYEDFDDE